MIKPGDVVTVESTFKCHNPCIKWYEAKGFHGIVQKGSRSPMGAVLVEFFGTDTWWIHPNWLSKQYEIQVE